MNVVELKKWFKELFIIDRPHKIDIFNEKIYIEFKNYNARYDFIDIKFNELYRNKLTFDIFMGPYIKLTTRKVIVNKPEFIETSKQNSIRLFKYNLYHSDNASLSISAVPYNKKIKQLNEYPSLNFNVYIVDDIHDIRSNNNISTDQLDIVKILYNTLTKNTKNNVVIYMHNNCYF